ncbi:MAG: hypothetical protein U9Q37_06320 [Euryarchaeota archaeon]|nr:hypothetical protein [Euryarchaeota archaeon]
MNYALFKEHRLNNVLPNQKGGEKKMRKWPITVGVGGVLVVALLLGSIVMPAFAHETSARHDATITPEPKQKRRL